MGYDRPAVPGWINTNSMFDGIQSATDPSITDRVHVDLKTQRVERCDRLLQCFSIPHGQPMAMRLIAIRIQQTSGPILNDSIDEELHGSSGEEVPDSCRFHGSTTFEKRSALS